MKTSLRKLKGFASLHKCAYLKEEKDHGIPARQDELLQASQDILEMRNRYDSLLSAAAATANSAYEFSEALQEMATCLLERTSLNDDEVSDRVLLILGEAQFELQKLVDSYRVHIIQTITTPSESLLKELQTVEEMKRQCDDKRDLYKFMLAAQREKGRTRLAKGENFSSQQLQAALDDYEEEANLFVFRLKSLKQGQSRSLLTQAARHHAAQLNFFRKGVKSLEMVEPHVKAVAEQQHIDYDFIGLVDDDKEFEENDCSYNAIDEGNLSFDYGNNEHIQDDFTMNRKSMEPATVQSHGDLLHSAGGTMAGSQSAPMKFEPSSRIKQMHSPSPMKCRTYVLPTPVDARNSLSAAGPDSDDQRPNHLSYSPPNKPATDVRYGLSGPMKKLHISDSALKDRSSSPIKLPPPLEPLLQSNSIFGSSDIKNIKRQAFSGPLIGKSWMSNPRLSANGTSRSPRLSQKINELHELPRPPMFSAKPERSSSLVGHSGPLVPRRRGLYAASEMPSSTASPLPAPPPVISRSFSIPSTSQRTGDFTMANFLEAAAEAFEQIPSPPLTLISFPTSKPQPKDPDQAF